MELPARPPFALRARVLTPLTAGGTRYESDAVVVVDAAGRISAIEPHDRWLARRDEGSDAFSLLDLRPWLVMPGLVDLHVHLPQVPAAGLGAGLDVLTWLDRYIFPLERAFDEAAADRLMPPILQSMARAGTTTMLAYGAIWPGSLDAAFRAAEAHGIRAVIGKVMMDELTYDERIPRERILDVSLRQSAELCERWHGADDGRLQYAFTPRFAVSCSAEMLRESAGLARHYGAYWQTHLSEDRGEIDEVARRFPEALDYLDVYDRAGALGERTILAHAVHLSDRELERIAESGSRIAHCPASNLFLASGVMPLARHLEAGAVVGLGSDVAGGPDLSIVTQMRVGAYVQNALRTVGDDPRSILDPLGWLRLGTLEGARVLGLDETIGSLETGKEADLIAVDPARTAPLPGIDSDDPAEIASRLVFRGHPEMVQAAWVRGRLLGR
ncbi:MAG: amidohydrolase family protein [Chloroflexota bacterium]|nr:amidohydrolase family protein [Chloroflexota bacterium]